jgi:hypothetical protein
VADLVRLRLLLALMLRVLLSDLQALLLRDVVVTFPTFLLFLRSGLALRIIELLN